MQKIVIGHTRLIIINVLFMTLTSFTAIKDVTYSAFDAKTEIPFDVTLSELMPFKNGTFIEVGANDGVRFSNTKRFEELYEWTGILIEPSPNLFNRLCKNRSNSKCFQCALGSFKEDGTYIHGDFDGHLMSSISGDRLNPPARNRVLVRSLQSILDECDYTHIHFFSLDVEGYELNILKGIDFTRTTFDYLLIEIYKHQYNDIVEFFSNKGYEMIRCLSNYSKELCPLWDGTHNDYLFKRQDL
ncbi:FkbM family methyltransferase [Candidatus Dependentiae bacterium]|nr:FkbM family methyltransferase [Candidatus Dependentiae bacterium]